MIVSDRELEGQYWTWIDVPNDVDGALAEGWRYELLGTMDGYLLPYSYFFCDDRCPRFLRCFSSEGGDGGSGLRYQDPSFPYPCDTVFTSVREPDISHLLRIGPNPVAAGQTLAVELNESIADEEVAVMLFDAAGRRIRTAVRRAAGTLRLELPPAIATGMYTLILRMPAGRAALRVIVV